MMLFRAVFLMPKFLDFAIKVVLGEKHCNAHGLRHDESINLRAFCSTVLIK